MYKRLAYFLREFYERVRRSSYRFCYKPRLDLSLYKRDVLNSTRECGGVH